MNIAEQNSVSPLPYENFVKEGRSRRDRLLSEVMEQLFALLPDDASGKCHFVLNDGTSCWIKKFSAPKVRRDGNLEYGFDVKFEEKSPISHLEFFVRCTGWERNLTSSSEDSAPNAP